MLSGDITLMPLKDSTLQVFDRGVSTIAPTGTTPNGVSFPEETVTSSAVDGAVTAAMPEVTTTYYVSDQVGSARAEVSFGSWPLWWGSFDPYGNETYANGTPNNFKFTGKERDTETGDDNFGARYYSSTLMRFMSPDPGWQMASDPANPLSWNQYQYVMGNPLSFIDPIGLQASSANPDNNGGNTNCYSDGNNNFGCEDGSNPPPPLPPANPMPIPIAVFPIFGGGKNSSQTTQQNNAAPSNAVPANPCAYMGRALPPSAYATAGQASKWNPVNAALDLSKGFKIGGYLDAQTLAQGNPFERAAYGNYAYGVWMAASGTPLFVALAGANEIAFIHKYEPGGNPNQYSGRQTGGPFYPSIPAANVANITAGYNAQQNGTTCHR